MNPETKPYLYVLDDEPDQAFLIGLAAQKTGEFADVRTAIDSQLAYHHLLEVAEDPEHRPGLILIDWKMPRMQGAEIAQALRDHPQLCDVPVVVLSSSSNEADRNLAMECGCRAVFQKPRDFMELVTMLKDIRRQFCRAPFSTSGEDELSTLTSPARYY